MNHTSKENLLKVVTHMRRKTCCYDGLMFEKEPLTCDCKYGFDPECKNYGSEQTGCPELRTIEALLHNITDEEIEKITYRHITKEYVEEVNKSIRKVWGKDETK